MLIRSQNKESIYNLNVLNGLVYNESSDYKRGKETEIKHEICIDTGVLDSIAEYSTKEKAIKVLDMIQEACYENEYSKFMGCENVSSYASNIFQMPQDSEVQT